MNFNTYCFFQKLLSRITQYFLLPNDYIILHNQFMIYDDRDTSICKWIFFSLFTVIFNVFDYTANHNTHLYHLHSKLNIHYDSYNFTLHSSGMNIQFISTHDCRNIHSAAMTSFTLETFTFNIKFYRCMGYKVYKQGAKVSQEDYDV